MPGHSDATAATGSASGIWKPKPTTRPWQFQLQGRIDTSIKAPVYEVDGFDTPARTVRKLQRKGRKVICYINVGSWENYRPDKGQFPKSVIGRKYDGYPDERWLDIRKYRAFAKPLKARFRMCAKKGFDAVEADNVAGYQNRTGFPLTAADQLEFNRWLARQAHRQGLSIGLKNDPSQVRQLVDDFDFAVVEQCFQYNECGSFQAVHPGRQGGLLGRVRNPEAQVLRAGQEAALQLRRQGVRPLRPAVAALPRWARDPGQRTRPSGAGRRGQPPSFSRSARASIRWSGSAAGFSPSPTRMPSRPAAWAPPTSVSARSPIIATRIADPFEWRPARKRSSARRSPSGRRRRSSAPGFPVITPFRPEAVSIAARIEPVPGQ